MVTTPSEPLEGLRAPIAESWHRAQLAGLEPDSALDGIDYGDVDRDGSLLSAARPVLDDLTARLAHTAYSTILVDRDGRVVHRSSDHRGVLRALDDLGVGIGASLHEDRVGTNAPGTVLETRRSLTVNGSEHFARPFRGYSCYAHPIFHPGTRRIVGALDLTARVAEANPLLPPLVIRAVADIEQRLLEAGTTCHARLLRAFGSAATRHRAVVAIGADLTMSNQAALDLLDTTDIARLRVLSRERPGAAHHELALASGLRVHVRATAVDGARDATLLDIEPRPSSRPLDAVRRPAGPAALAATPSPGPVLVCGPPGSGRTTLAVRRAPEQPVTVLSAAAALSEGADTWARQLGALVDAGGGTVVVDDLDLLPEPLIDLVGRHVATRRPPYVVLVSGPVDELSGRAAALAAQCVEPTVVAALAHRIHELGPLVARMLADLGCDPSVHLTPGALRALAARPWPGNLSELRAVLTHAATRRRTGAVTPADLPEAYRHAAPDRTLGLLDRAERDAIVAALEAHDGNKVRSAASLGISRSTLYAKLRTLRIVAD